ncbi:MAG: hypothetical protein WKF31_12170 [Thermoleophilaceae bacterium]
MNKEVPSAGRIAIMGLFAISCFGLVLFMWLTFGGSIPLQPEGYRFRAAFPEATSVAAEVGRAHGRRPDRQGQEAGARAGRRSQHRRDGHRERVRADPHGHAGHPPTEDPAGRDVRGAEPRLARRRRSSRRTRYSPAAR